jgi:hypothetical protein
MQVEWRFVFVTLPRWRVVPRCAFRKHGQFQFQWLFLYVHRWIIV